MWTGRIGLCSDEPELHVERVKGSHDLFSNIFSVDESDCIPESVNIQSECCENVCSFHVSEEQVFECVSE